MSYESKESLMVYHGLCAEMCPPRELMGCVSSAGCVITNSSLDPESGHHLARGGTRLIENRKNKVEMITCLGFHSSHERSTTFRRSSCFPEPTQSPWNWFQLAEARRVVSSRLVGRLPSGCLMFDGTEERRFRRHLSCVPAAANFVTEFGSGCRAADARRSRVWQADEPQCKSRLE